MHRSFAVRARRWGPAAQVWTTLAISPRLGTTEQVPLLRTTGGWGIAGWVCTGSGDYAVAPYDGRQGHCRVVSTGSEDYAVAPYDG